MTRRLCLVTGASAGIGAAFARKFAREGWDLALTARRADRLGELATELKDAHGASCLAIPADLSDPAAPQAILASIDAAGRVVDGLVNNAGFGLRGTFASTQWEEQARFLQIMATAPTELCHRVLPGMRERYFGRIINISSVTGHVPATAGHTLYAPVKHYLIRLSEALNAENAGTNVHVSAVSPGFTLSEFHDANGMREIVSTRLPKSVWQTSDQVADIGFQACEANVPVRVCGTMNKVMVAFVKMLPDPAARAVVRAQSKRYRDTK